MTIYWILLLYPALATLLPVRIEESGRKGLWVIMILVFWIFIGFRDGIGGDWENYVEHYVRVGTSAFIDSLAHRSIGYGLINWLFYHFSLGIHAVNALCAAIFLTGLGVFCWRQPSPWLAWLIATPYLIFVVATGYTAQSVAIGLVLWAFSELEGQQIRSFLILTAVATIFHKSALVIFIFLAPMMLQKPNFEQMGRWWKRKRSEKWGLIVLGALLAALLAIVFVSLPGIAASVEHYIERDYYESEGAQIRLLMNAVPAVLLLAMFYLPKDRKKLSTEWIWIWIGCAALCALPISFVASTVADRLSLFLIGLQPYVWTRVPLLVETPALRGVIACGIMLTYAAVMWVWFSFAEHAHFWKPYSSVLFP